jgi:hypothetical protein
MADEVANYVRIVVRKGGDQDQIKLFAADARIIEKDFSGPFDIGTLAGMAGGAALEKQTPVQISHYDAKSGEPRMGVGIAPQLVNGSYPLAIAYDFTTKWRPPFEAIEPIGKMYPDLIFEWEFNELATDISGKVIYCDALGVNQRLDWAEYWGELDDDGEEVEDEFFSTASRDEDFDCPRWFEAMTGFHVMGKLVVSVSEKLKSSEAEVEALKAELAAKKTG